MTVIQEEENREPQEPQRFKKEGWRYEYMQTLTQLQEEISKPFEEKLKRSMQLIRLFAKRENASVACSFGKDSMAVMHLCLEVNPKIKVNFNNTHVELKETMETKNKVVDDWNLNFYELHPANGVSFYSINDRIIREGQRLDDGHKHANQYSKKMGVWKIHPLLYWTEQEVWDYTKDNKLPINEAYSKYGIDRIGCLPCMSYKNWKENLGRIAPKLYCYICKRYCKYRGIQDPEFYQEEGAPEIYA